LFHGLSRQEPKKSQAILKDDDNNPFTRFLNEMVSVEGSGIPNLIPTSGARSKSRDESFSIEECSAPVNVKNNG
jgi:hypothetical protein